MSLDRVALALADVDDDEDVALVRGDRDLSRVDVEADETAVLVERAQRLDVGRELDLRVLVGRAERVDRLLARLEEIEQRLLRIALVADDVDVLDARDGPFGDVDVERDAVSLERLDVDVDAAAVVAGAEVDTPQLALDPLEDGAVVDPPGGDVGALQRGLELLGRNLRVAVDLQAADRRTLVDDDDQHVAVAPQHRDVVEQPRLVERAHGAGIVDARLEAIARAYRQVRQYRAEIDPLVALDDDVGDGERRARGRLRRTRLGEREPGLEERRDGDEEKRDGEGGARRTGERRHGRDAREGRTMAHRISRQMSL